MMKNTLLGALCLSLAASIWGGMYVVSKYVLDYIPPLSLVWMRYVIAFIFLYAILFYTQSKRNKGEFSAKKKKTKKDWILLAWIGFIGYFISIACQFIGTKLSDAHTGALITSATPAFMVIFARFILHEAFTARKIISVILATIGVIIVVGWDSGIGTYFVGSMILVGAAVTWALLSIYVKVAARRFSSLETTTYAILFALLFTTPTMIWEWQTEEFFFNDTLIILGILYLGIVSTAGAFFLWNKGLELLDAGVGSLFFFLQPIVGSFLGWLVLDEKLDIYFFLGGSLILLGVLIATVQPRSTNELKEEPV